MIFLRFLSVFFILFFQGIFSQNAILKQPKRTDSIFPTIQLNYTKNRIQNETQLQKIFQKLRLVQTGKLQNVSFVHIGDSHIQADMETAVIRRELQSFFGNAGRGLVFPYQLAKSNAPSDLIFESTELWKGNRLIKKNPEMPCGISGFVAQSIVGNASVNFRFRSLKDSIYKFDKITFFSDTMSKISNIEPIFKESEFINEVHTFAYEKPITDFKLRFNDSIPANVYGLVLENSKSTGILYHSIGVNGAKYSDYNEAHLFWKQLSNLKADCYIFSMGTNEAQNLGLTAELFIESVERSINKIREFNPEAVIILMSPPVSYYQKLHPNKKLKDFSEALASYCKVKQLPFWDLFEISNGLEGAREWRNKQLLGHDLVHFTRKGYEVQAFLFVEAFMNAWKITLKTD